MYVFCDKTLAQNNEIKIHEENHTGENLMRVLFVTKCLRKFRGTKFFFYEQKMILVLSFYDH